MMILRFLAQSYLWIGLGAASSYYYSTKLINGLEFNLLYALFLLSSTACLYNILASFKRKLDTRILLTISFTALTGAAALLKLADPILVLYLIPAVVIGFMYGYKGGLRKVPYLKVFLIAIIWVYTSAVIPLLKSDLIYEFSQVQFLLSMVLFLLGITIPFDVRDIYYDAPSIKTMPQVLGVKWSILLSVFSIAISGYLTYSYIHSSGYSTTFLWVLLWLPISLFLVGFSTEKRPKLYFTILLDGLLIIQGVLAYSFC